MSSATSALPAVIEKLRKSSDAFQNAHRDRDFAALASIFSHDAVVLPHTHQVLRGANAVREFYEESLRAGLMGSDMTVEPLSVDVVGDLGYVAGNWSALMPNPHGGSAPLEGFYLDVLKRFGEEWKIVCETWNVKPPEMAPAG